MKKSFIATAAVYALTAFHHYYGSRVYGTPWRAHVVVAGVPALLFCLLFMVLYQRFGMRVFLGVYLLACFVLFSLFIGLFEGFYNHLVKDVLFFSGMKEHSWRMLFPSPAYEKPNDLVFEATGILQFFVALVQVYYLRVLWKTAWRRK
jgi:hypothetical protein